MSRRRWNSSAAGAGRLAVDGARRPTSETVDTTVCGRPRHGPRRAAPRRRPGSRPILGRRVPAGLHARPRRRPGRSIPTIAAARRSGELRRRLPAPRHRRGLARRSERPLARAGLDGPVSHQCRGRGRGALGRGRLGAGFASAPSRFIGAQGLRPLRRDDGRPGHGRALARQRTDLVPSPASAGRPADASSSGRTSSRATPAASPSATRSSWPRAGSAASSRLGDSKPM